MDEKLKKLMSDGWSWRVYGSSSGGSGESDGETQTYILVDEDGNEFPAVLVSEETVFDATANDIREGKTAASGEGVVTGTKVIPSYNTTEGVKYIEAGSTFAIKLAVNDLYDYSKLQAIFCPFNTSTSDSVMAENVAIEGSVYPVLSTTVKSTITTNPNTKTIEFGFDNTSDIPYLIRYFTYKEIY